MAAISIIGVGDIMLGSTWPDSSRMPPNDGKGLLAPAASVLGRADIAFGNLEGPLCDGGTVTAGKANAAHSYAFRSPTRFAAYLKSAGLDIVSVANNHASDFDAFGRRSTEAALTKQGIKAVGRSGGDIVECRKVTFVAFATNRVSPNLNELASARTLVASAKRRGGRVVVSFHGGAEGAGHTHVPRGPESFYGEARGDLRRFAHTVVDAGADLVLGHGPHVLRALELYKGRLIAYSLGNFATYGWISVKGPGGITCALEARLAEDGRFLGGKIHPFVQSGRGGPRPDKSGEAIRVLQALGRADFGVSGAPISADGTIRA